jgi:hypothetical protein
MNESQPAMGISNGCGQFFGRLQSRLKAKLVEF